MAKNGGFVAIRVTIEDYNHMIVTPWNSFNYGNITINVGRFNALKKRLEKNPTISHTG